MMIVKKFLRMLWENSIHPFPFIEGRVNDFWKLQDEAFLATWCPKDGEKIRDMTTAARYGYLDEERASRYFDNLNNGVKRIWNDQTLQEGQIEPEEASYKQDMITDYGMTLFCNLIVGKFQPLISHMGIGDGTGATYGYMDVLFAEKVRLAFGQAGYINALGRTLRYQMTFDIMVPSYDFAEIGLFNTEVLGSGPLIARSVFNPVVPHVSGSNYITAAYIVTTLSS